MSLYERLFAANLYGSLLLVISMTVCWLISVRKQDASLVDRIWGLGFVSVFFAYLSASPNLTTYKIGVFALLCMWGIRLSWHIHTRNRHHGEDARYQSMRRTTGPSFWWKSFFFVFLLQACLLWLISWPLLSIATASAQTVGLSDAVGVLFWCIGFYFEAVGDTQLKRFKANPENKGKVLDSGLWALTRHPNYFGDALIWWGFWLMSYSSGLAGLTIISPLVMTFLLRKVSGVALLERSMRAKNPAYERYVRDVPAFFPSLRSPRREKPS